MTKLFFTIIVGLLFSFTQAQDNNLALVQQAAAADWEAPAPDMASSETPAAMADAAFSCGRPSNLLTSNVTTTTAFLSWRAVSGAFSYTVELQRPYVSAAWVNAGVAGTNSFSLTNLAPNELYYWRVRTNCSRSVSSYATSPFFFTQALAFCTAPTFTFVSPITITATSAVLGWDAQAAALSYTVEFRPLGSAAWLFGGTPVQNTITLTGLAPATSYEFRVSTNCFNGSSAFFGPTQFLTAAITCVPPVSVAVSNITTTTADVSWPAAPGATSYIVDLRPAGTATWTLTFNNAFAPTTSRFVSNLAPGTLYDCRVRTVCSSGATSDGILTQFITSAAACNAPTGLVSSEITEFGALLNWSAVAGAESYTIEFKAASSTTWITAASTLGTSIRLLNINPATVYDWRVRSNCAPFGTVSAFTTAQFTTVAASGGGGTCAEPTGLSSFGDCQAADLVWAPVAGALSYRVEFKLTTSINWTVATTGTTATFININANGGNYNWRVQANCASGSSAFANATVRILGGAACNQRIQQQRNSAVEQVEQTAAPLKALPQPARNELTVSYQAEENGIGQIVIVNQLGARVLSNSISVRKGSNTARLNVSKLLPGAYILQVNTKGGTETTKVIIQ